jgi:hypothetical protein
LSQPPPLAQVDGHDDGLVTGALDSFDEPAGDAAVFGNIELKPLRPPAGRGDLFDAVTDAAADSETRLRRRRRAGRSQPSLRVIQTLSGNRRQQNRHRHRLLENGGGRIGLGDTREQRRQNAQSLKGGDVFAQRDFVRRAGGDIFVRRLRQGVAGQFLKIGDIRRFPPGSIGTRGNPAARGRLAPAWLLPTHRRTP